jgi:hypothetical protein
VPSDAELDEQRLTEISATLADGIDRALPGWVERSVRRVLDAWQGPDATPDPAVLAEARVAGIAARDDVGARVRRLLESDIDDQRTNPLAVLRGAVPYPTAVLRAAGVPEVVRDSFAEAHDPDDVYDLSPASFADIDPALNEPGLVWGAAKAHVHLQRRRRDGMR